MCWKSGQKFSGWLDSSAPFARKGAASEFAVPPVAGQATDAEATEAWLDRLVALARADDGFHKEEQEGHEE